MPRTTKPPKKPKAGANATATETPPPAPAAGEVLTLAEAAAYLRLSEAEVTNLVHSQGLPGRAVGGGWRFLKTALQDWLRTPSGKKGLLSQIGALKDDPYLEEMLQEIYKRRGRPMTEEG
jgi:excisionase family DNA binding protein